MIFVLLVFGLPIFILLMVAIIPSCPTDHGFAEIEFESFKKFYDINPERWELYDEHVCCATDIKYGMIWNSEKFQFNYLDFQKYKKWLKNKKSRDKEMANMQSTAKMIAAVKQDIEKLERMSDTEINKAKSIIEILCEVR